MVNEKLRKYLDDSGVPYEVITHGEAYTAQEIAESMHVKGGKLAKVVMLKSEIGFIMAVVPADRVVDISKLRQAMNIKMAALAGESEFKSVFPDCDVGAMPPFGNLYGIPVSVDKSLAGDDIVFQAGTHYEAIRMRFDDYKELVRPLIMSAVRKAA